LAHLTVFYFNFAVLPVAMDITVKLSDEMHVVLKVCLFYLSTDYTLLLIIYN